MHAKFSNFLPPVRITQPPSLSSSAMSASRPTHLSADVLYGRSHTRPEGGSEFGFSYTTQVLSFFPPVPSLNLAVVLSIASSVTQSFSRSHPSSSRRHFHALFRLSLESNSGLDRRTRRICTAASPQRTYKAPRLPSMVIAICWYGSLYISMIKCQINMQIFHRAFFVFFLLILSLMSIKSLRTFLSRTALAVRTPA